MVGHSLFFSSIPPAESLLRVIGIVKYRCKGGCESYHVNRLSYRLKWRTL